MWGIAVDYLPLVGGAVLWLVFLEGLLSADNALVLAMMVRHLPKENQKRALRYGIWGAFAFRFIAVGLAKYLLDLWYLKVAGGVYLLYLAVNHVLSRGDGELAIGARFGSGFWGTVASVELADIAFSMDSILAAVAAAEGLPARIPEVWKLGVVYTGGVLGIITMRFVAGWFILLLEKFKGLESCAFALVAWIGLKLILGGLFHAQLIPVEINGWVFWIGMFLIVVAGFVYKPKEKKTGREPELVGDIVEVAGGERRDGGTAGEAERGA